MPIPVDVVIGARPNVVKAAPLLREVSRTGAFQTRLVDTGQHYDRLLLGAFLEDLGLGAPDISLGVGSAPREVQIEQVRSAYGKHLEANSPEWVIVFGDVNSTLGASYAAVDAGVPVAHVEAGLRSFDLSMPEELNRIQVDHMSTLLFTSEEGAAANLIREGIDPSRVVWIGNLMADCLLQEQPRIDAAPTLAEAGSYAFATLHRPANVDDPAQLAELLEALSEVGDVLLAAHPRTQSKLPASLPKGLKVIPPQPYHSGLKLIRDAREVLTDSGGMQIEAALLGTPCYVLRETTEHRVLVEGGHIRVAGVSRDSLRLARALPWGEKRPIPGADGRAATRLVAALST